MRGRPLFVPVTLDVLLLGKPGEEQLLADFTPDYRLLNESNLFGNRIANSGFASKQGLPGAHLHWTMPDALLDGKQGEDGGITFPELPNRWIVMRIEAGVHCDSVKRKVWLVESDAVTYTREKTGQGMQKTSIPCLRYDEVEKIWKPAGKGGAYYAFLGNALEFAAENGEETGHLDRLTAVGAGDHLFSAFYPLCRTVFGFYDPLDDGAGTYTYTVFGYYDRDVSDPFYGADAETVAERFGWEWEKKRENPDSMICHGTAFEVHWQGRDYCYINRNGAHLDLVLANTSAEALSCYLQNRMPEKKAAERTLNAFLCGALEEFDNCEQPDSLIRLEDSLHERQFGYSGGGENWKLRAMEPNAENGEVNLLGEEEEVVRDLQDLYEEINRARRQKESYSEESYYCWHRYVECLTSPFSSEDEKKAKEAFQTAYQGFCEEAKSEKNAGDRLEKIKAKVDGILKEKGLHMVSVPERSFVHPNPPVLLMVEEGTERVFRQGFQKDESGKLPCRMRFVDTLSIELPEGEVTLAAEDIEPLWEKILGTLPTIAEAFCTETILLGEPFARILARLALKKAGVLEIEKRLDETAELVAAAQKASGNRPFAISFQEWKMPWNPIMMEWQVKLTPARTDLKNDNTFDCFQLGEIDLEASDTDFQGKEITVSGQTLFTPHAPLLMKKKMEKLLKDYGDASEEYQKIKEFAQKLQERQILSQQLTGFYEALQGLRYVPAIPILSVPGKPETKVQAIHMQEMVNHIYPVTIPGKDSCDFLPIRGGTMKLERFRLIDTFGQFREVDVSEYHMAVSEALHCDRENCALLPPRFPGGMRMVYHWVSAEDANKRSLGKASSPICGFLMANVFERNLQVHEAGGTFLGWLQQTDEGVKWRSAPGTSLRPEDIRGTQLGLFVRGVLGWENAMFERLLKQTDRYFSKRAGTEEAANPALYIGNVLALARASFAVEEEGRHKLFWGGEEPCTGGYEKAKFPLKLGDARRVSDGLVGFFADRSGSEDYGRLHLSVEEDDVLEDNQIYLSLEDSARTVTLLLDPYREVTLRTGFLPVLRERLSPELYKAQTDGMQPFLKLWPVLSLSGKAELPMTEVAGRKLEVTRVGKGQTVTVQAVERGLSPLLPDRRPEILEGYLSWKEETRHV